MAFAPNVNRDLNPKDTLRNIQATGEYVINVVTYEMRERMNQTSADYPYGVSEWEEAGFAPAPAVKVRPARVACSPLAMECRLFQIVTHGAGPAAAHYVIGEVVYYHVAARLMVDGSIDPALVDYIGRMSGAWYSRTRPDAMFELPRP